MIKTDDAGSYTRGPGGELGYATRMTEIPLKIVPETERKGSKISKEPPRGSFY